MSDLDFNPPGMARATFMDTRFYGRSGYRSREIEVGSTRVRTPRGGPPTFPDKHRCQDVLRATRYHISELVRRGHDMGRDRFVRIALEIQTVLAA